MGEKIWSEDEILQQDLERIADSKEIDWEKLRGKCILVTGATGLIGSILARALVCASESRGLGLRVIAMVRNRAKAEKLFGPFLDAGLELLVRDILEHVVGSAERKRPYHGLVGGLFGKHDDGRGALPEEIARLAVGKRELADDGVEFFAREELPRRGDRLRRADRIADLPEVFGERPHDALGVDHENFPLEFIVHGCISCEKSNTV